MPTARSLSLVLAVAAACSIPIATAMAAQVTLSAAADNTLYEPASANLSNGAGEYLFAGRIIRGDNRKRALVRFDLSGIPAGSTITGVQLNLFMSRTIAIALPFDLHRVTQSWGEGASDAFGEEGGGTDAAPNDASWLHRFFSTTLWTTPGGDFIAAPSATTLVDQFGPYSWSGSGLVADVQAWLDASAPNHGWILLGPEGEHSAKRFNSRENPDLTTRPTLVVTFTAPPSLCQGDANGDGVVSFADITSVLNNFGAVYTPVLTGAGDANHNGVVNFADITTVLNFFNQPCL